MKDRRLFAFLFLFVWALPAAHSQQRPNTALDTNERIRQLASIQGRQGDTVIGGGDLLQIQVFDVPDMSRDVRVSDSGYFSLPLVPARIRASGLTTFQLEEKLVELLQVNGLVAFNFQLPANALLFFLQAHLATFESPSAAGKNP